jgi:FkbM family methyltransferase
LLYENLPLKTDDLVIDGGGYHGNWTNEILCRYGCRSILFEPVPLFAESLRRRYASNSRVEVCEVALANRTGYARIAFAQNSSSIFLMPSDAEMLDIALLDFCSFLRERGIRELACLKLNIEGGEYDVLEQLISLNLLSMIRCLLVQFHRIEPQSEARRDLIQQALRKTHQCRFDYPFVWECWVRSK